MEVPPISRSSCVVQQRSVEQIVGIPVHGGVKHARGGLPCSVTGQSSTAISGAAEKVCAWQKIVAEKSVAKVAERAEAVSAAAKAGKFKIASQKTGAEKSVAKVPKLAESESVAEKAGTFETAPQKTEVGSAASSGAAASGGLQGSVRRQSSTAVSGGLQGTVPGQSSRAIRGAEHRDHGGFPPRQLSSAFRGAEHHDHHGAVSVQQLVVELWVQQLVVELIIKALSQDRVQLPSVVFTFAKLLKSLYFATQSRMRTRRTRTWRRWRSSTSLWTASSTPAGDCIAFHSVGCA